MRKLTLEQLIEIGRNAPRNGDFGITSCKKSIKDFIEMCKGHGNEKSLYELLGVYVERANTDAFFNAIMVYACWELINEY